MNYQRIYDALISFAEARGKPSGYSEAHHIIPKCMGGADSKDNLVNLTAREHWVAHRLLIKIFPGNYKLVFAAKQMTMTTGRQQRVVNSKQFDAIRVAHADALSKIHKGRRKSDAEKQKRSDSYTPEKRKAVSDRFKGKPTWNTGKFGKDSIRYGSQCSEEAKKKIGDANRGKTWSDDRRAKILNARKKARDPIPNVLGYEILTPTGFQPFAGVSWRGASKSLEIILKNGLSVIVSYDHKFGTADKIASDYRVGDVIPTDMGLLEIAADRKSVV